MTDDPIDLERIIEEIDDEVHRRRAEGGLDPELERELDELFDAGAPPGVTADFPRLLDQAQRAALIDATPPSGSNRTGGETVKRALGRTMSWYVGNVTRQVSTLGTDLVEGLRVLGDRVVRLEHALGPAATGEHASLLDPHLDLGPWTETVVGLLRSARGRVLHGDAGDGTVVRALLDGGVDAYGVEPRPALAELAIARNVDVREERVEEHLVALPPDSLGGLVLSGCVDTLPNAARERLVLAARRAVVAGGACAVIAWDPKHWGDAATGLVADLAPGRPWHAATWSHLLANSGFETDSVGSGPAPHGQVLVATRRRA